MKINFKGCKKYLIFFKKIVNFSQRFVVYHGCGNSYQYGTRRIISKNRTCIAPTYHPFWKRPIDVHNKVETRAQLIVKTKATRNYQKRYMQFADVFSKDKFSSDDFPSAEESLANNASNTEQNLFSDDETENTGENLVSDENTDTTQTNLISRTQNPDNETIQTNNKSLPRSM